MKDEIARARTCLNTDDADPRKVLETVLDCAYSWSPEARIIGNVRAGDISRAVESILRKSDDISRRLQEPDMVEAVAHIIAGMPDTVDCNKARRVLAAVAKKLGE